MKNNYSLWVVPPTKIKQQLETVINQLSNEYNAPRFEAHMTILGGFDEEEKEMLNKARQIAKKIKPFVLSLDKVSCSTTYVQNVLVRVTVTKEVLEANMVAKKVMKKENDMFMPHISLMYGDHTMKERAEIALKINLPREISFDVSKLVVMETGANIEKWKCLDEISF